MEDSIAIANYFIELANKQKQSISPMKLQKLLYFAHGWHLALSGEPLLDEHIEAWQYGPVIPSIYHEFKSYGEQPISSLAKRAIMVGNNFSLETPKLTANSNLPPLLDKIWEVYGKYTGVQLSNATHMPDTPWYKIWEEQNGKDKKGTDIPDSLIKDYFKIHLVQK